MTKIEWTDESWNPIIGCTKVSPGCRNCYAEKFAKRLARMGQSSYEEVTSRRGWNNQVRFIESALEKPLKWKKPRRIFVNSMSDLFHPEVRDEWISQVWEIMEATPRHTYQILTKRSKRMADWVNGNYSTPLPNVRLGVSVENDGQLHRVEDLLNTYSAYSFLSVEPLLDRLTGLKTYLRWSKRGINQVIVGGESGAGAREFHLEWAYEIQKSCHINSIPFFFKQGGSNCWFEEKPLKLKGKGGDWDDPLFPDDLKVREE